MSTNDTNDIFTMSHIIRNLDDNDLQYILYFLHMSPNLETLQIILLHSLHYNNQLNQDEKNNIEIRMIHFCRLYTKDDVKLIDYSFHEIIKVLQKIFNMNINTFYLIFGLMYTDDEFKDDMDQSLYQNSILTDEEALSFSNTFPYLYEKLSYLLLNNYNRNATVDRYVSQIKSDFIKYSFDNISNLHPDFPKVFNIRKLLLGYRGQDETDEELADNIEQIKTDIFVNSTADYLNNIPYVFRIETLDYIFENVDDTMGRYYMENNTLLNYFICGIHNNTTLCSQFLKVFGPDFCNLSYNDELNGTPLMFACGLALDKPEEPIPPEEPRRNQINGGNDDDDLTEPPSYQSLFPQSTNNLTDPPPAPTLPTRSISRINQELAEPQSLFNNDDTDDDELPDYQPQLIRQHNYEESMQQYNADMEEYREQMIIYQENLDKYNQILPNFIDLAIAILSYGPEVSNLELANTYGNRYTAYNYAIKHRMNYVVYAIDYYRYPNTQMYNEPVNIQLRSNQVIHDILEMEDIEAKDINDYLNEDNNRAVFYDGTNYSVIDLGALKTNLIDGKRYPCNITANTIFRPSEDMINRNLAMFHMDKIGGYPMNDKSILYEDVINMHTNRSRYYVAEQIPDMSYVSFVNCRLVDSANIIESAVSATHCNPGANGYIYRLRAASIDITQGGSKIKYKRRHSKRKSSKRKSSKRKSSKRKSLKRK